MHFVTADRRTGTSWCGAQRGRAVSSLTIYICFGKLPARKESEKLEPIILHHRQDFGAFKLGSVRSEESN